MTRLFLAFVQVGECGPVHVGLTSNVKSHLRRMQSCNPYAVRLVAAVRGSYSRETLILRRLAPFLLGRARWFAPGPALGVARVLEASDAEREAVALDRAS